MFSLRFIWDHSDVPSLSIVRQTTCSSRKTEFSLPYKTINYYITLLDNQNRIIDDVDKK